MSKGAGAQFSAEVPKGDGWAVGGAVDDAARELVKTGHSPLIPCIAVIDVKEVKVSEGGSRVPVVRLRRLEALDDDDTIREGHRLVMRAWQKRHAGRVMPHEVKEIIDEAFAGVDVDGLAVEEQDEREAAEDEALTDMERLRRHMKALHNLDVDPDDPDHEVTRQHDADHDRDASDGLPEHDREWWAWRRVDLEAGEATDDTDDTEVRMAEPDELGTPAIQFDDGSAGGDDDDN
jgi:hypothetical protein